MTASPPSDPSNRTETADERFSNRLVSAATRASTPRALVALALVVAALSAAVVPAVAQSDGTFALTTEEVASVEGQTIRGTTTLDAGTELQVRVQSAGETDPQFLQTDSATVGPDGGWNATFDFAPVETHDAVAITVVAGENSSADYEVPIRNDRATPTESASDTSTPGFGVAAAATALVGAAFLLRTRR